MAVLLNRIQPFFVALTTLLYFNNLYDACHFLFHTSLMDIILDFFHHLINPKWILEHGGIWLVLMIVFAETGFFLGCFLPGDSLLFIIGMSLSDGKGLFLFKGVSIGVISVIFLIALAGIMGNILGYWFGKKSGELLYQRKNSFFFKQQYLEQAHDFYEKYGATTIVIARFLPIIRTFAPIIAGIVRMNKRTFLVYNMIGSIAWVFIMVLLGYFLGKHFPVLQEKLDLIVISIILVTTVPVFYKILRYRLKQKKLSSEK